MPKDPRKPKRPEPDVNALWPFIEALKRLLALEIGEYPEPGGEDGNVLGMAIATSLSLFVERNGPHAALGFIGEIKEYLGQALAHLAEHAGSDVESGPGIIARRGYDPIKTSVGPVNRAMCGVVRSRSGSLYLLDVSHNDAVMLPMTAAEAAAWLLEHGGEKDIAAIVDRLRGTGRA
jgi:hypothetical protein